MRIYISPSNQSSNLYSGVPMTEEKNCEYIALRVAAALTQAGHTVKVATLNLFYGDRPKEALAFGAELYLAIHTNATGTAYHNATGAVAFYNTEAMKLLCQKMVVALNAIAPLPSNRAKSVIYRVDDLAEVRLPNKFGIDVCFVEINFHDNPKIAPWLVKDRDRIADTMSSVILGGVKPTMENGPEVLKLQQDLVALGYKLVVDGWYGDETKGVVRQFQAATGLVVDGIAGVNTKAMIASMLAPVTLLVVGIPKFRAEALAKEFSKSAIL